MCLPAAAIPIVIGATQAAGALVGGYSALQQGKYESRIAKQNAAIEREGASDSLKQGEWERRKYWRDVGRTKGQNIAAMAANGIDVDFGAGERLQGDTQDLANEDAGNLYGNINQRTSGFIINAANYSAEAKAAKARGKSAFVGSLFEAGGSLLSGFQQSKGLKAKMGSSPKTGSSYAGGGRAIVPFGM
jgi:hypothetical protein